MSEHASPTVRSLMDAHGVSMRSACISNFESISIDDSLDPTFGLNFEPTERVASFVGAAQAAAKRKMSSRAVASSGGGVSSASHVFVPGRGSDFEDVLFVRPKKVAAKPYEPAFILQEEFSSKAAEKTAVEKWALEVLAFMNDSVKERFLKGRSAMAAQLHDELVLESVKNSAQTDQLRSTVYALRRLNEWAKFRHGSGHGFNLPDSYVAWFLRENLVNSDHVSQSLVAGLRFASDKLMFPFSVSSSSLRALAKAPTKTPKQAPSASVRVVHHFWEVACNESYSLPLRGVSAIFLVMSVCALRGIDAQRSKFDSEHGGGSSYRFFSAFAFNSKNRTCMPWACPIVIFGVSELWYAALRAVWKSRDFMFPAVARGASLADVQEVLQCPASAYLILRYLREILQLPSLSISGEDAARLRRHSFRHWIANMMRVLKFSWSESFQGGRWKESSVMPLRYAQEVQFVASVDIIVRVIQACEAVLRDQPLDSWPLFGGWERFLPDRRFSSPEETPALAYEPSASDDDSGGDSSDDEEAGANVTVAPSVSKRELPPGWRREDHTISNERVYPTFHGPGSVRARSLAGAWRIHGDSTAASAATVPVAKPPQGVKCISVLGVGDRVSVWWVLDAIFYDGVVASLDVTLFTIDYDDGATMSHAFRDTFVASASDVAAFSAAQAVQASGGQVQPRTAAPEPEQQLPPRGSSRCSVPECSVLSVNGLHRGLHMFPPTGKRRSVSPAVRL